MVVRHAATKFAIAFLLTCPGLAIPFLPLDDGMATPEPSMATPEPLMTLPPLPMAPLDPSMPLPSMTQPPLPPLPQRPPPRPPQPTKPNTPDAPLPHGISRKPNDGWLAVGRFPQTPSRQHRPRRPRPPPMQEEPMEPGQHWVWHEIDAPGRQSVPNTPKLPLHMPVFPTPMQQPKPTYTAPPAPKPRRRLQLPSDPIRKDLKPIRSNQWAHRSLTPLDESIPSPQPKSKVIDTPIPTEGQGEEPPSESTDDATEPSIVMPSEPPEPVVPTEDLWEQPPVTATQEPFVPTEGQSEDPPSAPAPSPLDLLNGALETNPGGLSEPSEAGPQQQQPAPTTSNIIRRSNQWGQMNKPTPLPLENAQPKQQWEKIMPSQSENVQPEPAIQSEQTESKSTVSRTFDSPTPTEGQWEETPSESTMDAIEPSAAMPSEPTTEPFTATPEPVATPKDHRVLPPNIPIPDGSEMQDVPTESPLEQPLSIPTPDVPSPLDEFEPVWDDASME